MDLCQKYDAGAASRSGHSGDRLSDCDYAQQPGVLGEDAARVLLRSLFYKRDRDRLRMDGALSTAGRTDQRISSVGRSNRSATLVFLS
ncbi:hypothetical protein D3C84_1134850 [compost metagenome]